MNTSDQPTGEPASTEVHNQTSLQLPADTMALSGRIGSCQPTASPTLPQVNAINDKAIYTAQYSPLGNADQSMVEDQPSDETGLSMGDTDQSMIESLAADKAVLSKDEADQSMVEHLLGDEAIVSKADTNQPRVGHLSLEEHS